MEQATQKIDQEYWRPALAHPRRESSIDLRSPEAVCQNCDSEFVMGAHFCHVCGAGRNTSVNSTYRWTEALDFDNIRHALGLSFASLVAFIFGMVSVLAAFAVGFIYSANTLTDWQAVQTWRIEWMLAAVVAFVAGILLKKTDRSEN